MPIDACECHCSGPSLCLTLAPCLVVQVPTDFYSYLSGQPLSSAAGTRFASSAAAVIAVAATAAAVLMLGA